MNCPKCGSVLAAGNRFCMICGTPVGDSAPQAAPGPETQANPVPLAEQATIPYYQPVMQGNFITLPLSRKFRILCPNCRHVSDDIKRDLTAGFPCPVCNKAYAYGGQVLIYRMGCFYPLYAAATMSIIIDGQDYGRITNQESVRIMLPPGPHTVCCGNVGQKTSNGFQIVISPEYYNFAFKFNLVYHGPFTTPGRGIPMEFIQCAPEEIPNI
jgi:hypothetical protein